MPPVRRFMLSQKTKSRMLDKGKCKDVVEEATGAW